MKSVKITISENTPMHMCSTSMRNKHQNKISKDKQDTKEIWILSRNVVADTLITLFIRKETQTYRCQHIQEICQHLKHTCHHPQ